MVTMEKHQNCQEIDIVEIIRVLFRYKMIIVVVSLLSCFVAMMISVRQPRMYVANTTIVPPIGTSSGQDGLLGKLSGSASSLFQGVFNKGGFSGLYVSILKSRAVANALIDRFNLLENAGEGTTREDVRTSLMNSTTIEVSSNGIINISVVNADPNHAAELANAYVDELDQLNKRLSGAQATSKRVFLENRLVEIREDLSKIDNLKTREVEFKEMLFEMLAQQYELAKIEEVKGMPTIQVLDEAVVPDRGIARGTVGKGQIAGVGAFLVMSCLALVYDYLKRKGQVGVTLDPAQGCDANVNETPVAVEYRERRKIVSTHRTRVECKEDTLV